jgi:hypothetical protein
MPALRALASGPARVITPGELVTPEYDGLPVQRAPHRGDDDSRPDHDRHGHAVVAAPRRGDDDNPLLSWTQQEMLALLSLAGR